MNETRQHDVTRTGLRGRLSVKRPRRSLLLAIALGSPLAFVSTGATRGFQGDGATSQPGGPTLDETRMVLGKWIETQQIIAKERNEWQQGREILVGRLELVKKEFSTLEEKIAQAQKSVDESDAKRRELEAQNLQLKATGDQLASAVTTVESEIRRLFAALPEPTREKLQPLFQRIPEDAETTHVSIAERFQNVLGILNELNKENNEITVGYEVRNLADGKPAEVRTMYIGLAQAYYVSAGGEAGIGRPSETGWRWEPSKAIANDVLTAFDIIQGKHTPAFVPLPVNLQ